jgi:excinuclease ABC subunit C
VLHLIQQIRDETHRFAVTFHRLRRGKRQTKTALRDIPGVGPLTARRLLREFGSVANVQRAGVEGLSRVITRKSAEKILAHLHARAAESAATESTATEENPTDSNVTTTTS